MSIETVLTAIVGGLFGGGITILVAFMQSRNNLKRDYIKIAHELAIEEYRTRLEVAKINGKAVTIPPIEANMAYYTVYTGDVDHPVSD